MSRTPLTLDTAADPSFVHTWVPDQCQKLIQENINKVSLPLLRSSSRQNLVDQDEYPSSQNVHERCISMISHLWHAPKSATAMGTATTGSSEAIMLGGLALKKRWQARQKAAGKSIHEPGPNIVMGAEAQVALEKFARYFDVECRLVPVSQEVSTPRRFAPTPEQLRHVRERGDEIRRRKHHRRLCVSRPGNLR